ncbi:hypothetical protein [Paenilisteria newyorkensis]|uniref:hypothetical protein n=1 Tax=Listeria newyorkensis TaxID=1497681 RepID=UPI000669BD0A|nr:hypothetical protein [Listeria newyorkensis]KMT58929.1 hypothetical protein X559_2935 [Listeria newyorkensis]
MNEEFAKRLVVATESIVKSLSTLAEDTKANRTLKEKIVSDFDSLENAIRDLKADPFGLK